MADETKERPLAEQPYIGAGVDELRKQRLVEYSQYVAKEPIFIGGALAFTEAEKNKTLAFVQIHQNGEHLYPLMLSGGNLRILGRSNDNP